MTHGFEHLTEQAGTNTYETQKEMELLVLKNMETAIDTGKLLTCIPETPQEKAAL